MAEATASVALIPIDEALVRLTAAVSDEQARLTAVVSDQQAATQRANLKKVHKLLGQESAPKPQQPTSEVAGLHWRRRETAIKLLADALGRGDQRPLLRKPDGDLIPLTSAEWRAYPFRHETLMSGIWRGSAGPAGLLEYDQFPVQLSEEAFRSWCERVAPEYKKLNPPPRFELSATKPKGVGEKEWRVMKALLELRNTDPRGFDQLVYRAKRKDAVEKRLGSGVHFSDSTFDRAEAKLKKHCKPYW